MTESKVRSRLIAAGGSVPRYYIDTDDGDLCVVDEDGHDLPDAEAARRLALTNLPEMASDAIPGGDRRSFTARVRDAEGTVLYSAELTLAGEWHGGQAPR